MLVAVAMATWEHLRATCCPGLPEFDQSNVSYNCFRCGVWGHCFYQGA